MKIFEEFKTDISVNSTFCTISLCLHYSMLQSCDINCSCYLHWNYAIRWFYYLKKYGRGKFNVNLIH